MNGLAISKVTPGTSSVDSSSSEASSSYAAAQSRVELAREEGDDVLEMPASAGFRLRDVPSLSGLDALRFVCLKGHGLLEFPRVLFGLSTLRGIDVSENKIPTIPPDITTVVRLSSLDVAQNAIRMVDGEDSECSEVLKKMFKMSELVRIVLQKNCIGAGWQKELLKLGDEAHVTVLVAGCTEPQREPES